MADLAKYSERRLKNEARSLNQMRWMILIFLLPPGDNEMNLEKLKAMPTQEVIDLYNDLTQKQVKRMATRAAALKRTEEELRKAGKWEEVIKPEDRSAKEAANIHETAKAGANTGNPDRREPPKGKKAARKPQEKPAKAVPEAKPTKGKGKKAAAAEKPTPAVKEKGAAKVRKGAPSKNPTFTAIGEKAKGYNPKGFKPQAGSARMVVLDAIKKSPGISRDKLLKEFAEVDVNVDSALYYLSKYGFATIAE